MHPALENTSATSILQSPDGNTLVSTHKGIFVLSSDHTLIATVHLPSDHVNALATDSKGKLYAATDKGMALLGNANNGYEGQMLTDGRAQFIYIDKQDGIWFNSGGSIYYADPGFFPNEKKLQPVATNIDVVTTITVGDELWLGSRGSGIFRFSIAEHRLLEQLRLSENDAEVCNSVLSFFCDRSKNLWIGTLDGLYICSACASPFHTLDVKDSESTLARTIVSAISVDSPNNIVWIGTSGGLHKLTWEGDVPAIEHFYDNRSTSNFVANNRIQMLAVCPDGRLLISTKNILEYFDPKQNEYVSSEQMESICKQYGMRYVRAVFPDSIGNIWLAFNEGGVAKWDVKSENLSALRWNTYKQDVHRAIAIDKAGNLWLSSDSEGLFRLTLSNNQDEVVSSRRYERQQFNHRCITSMKILHDGRILVGTFDGLYVYHPGQDGFVSCQLPNAEEQAYISTIQEDPAGRVWVSGIKGMYRLQEGEEPAYFEVFHDRDINKLSYIVGHAVAPDGRIYLGTTQGPIWYRPEEVQIDSSGSYPYISRVAINNKRVDSLGCNINYMTSPLILQADERQISFEFAAINFNQPTQIQYAYRLDGVDRDWVYTTASRRVATYSNLPYGKSVFHLRATNGNGQWLPGEHTIELNILRPWYLRWWALLLFASLIMAMAWIIFHLIRYTLRLVRDKMTLQKRITNMATTPNTVNVVSGDEAFLAAVLQLVEQNIDNEQFSVEQMASTLCMSKSGLYRRMIQLTQLAPLEYIRTVRMKRAADLLRTNRYRVYEVCNMVGFSDQRYFSQCFKAQYGVTPKNYSLYNKDTQSDDLSEDSSKE